MNSSLVGFLIQILTIFLPDLAPPYVGVEPYGFYIGFIDKYMLGKFFWTDGSMADYQNWGTGEPYIYGRVNGSLSCTVLIVNGTTSASDTVYFWVRNAYHKWVNQFCEEQYSGVACKKEAIKTLKGGMTAPVTSTTTAFATIGSNSTPAIQKSTLPVQQDSSGISTTKALASSTTFASITSSNTTKNIATTTTISKTTTSKASESQETLLFVIAFLCFCVL